MIEKRTLIPVQEKKSNRNVPKVIKWKGISMIRNHSFFASIHEIVDYSEEMDVVRVGIVGDMHSGKSTLAMTIGHSVHKLAKIPYAVRVFYREDLKNFKKTLQALQPANYVLIFDDVSFLKDTSVIEQEVTEIRHFEGGFDAKIILIFNFHYPKALPPFLREFQFKYVTSIGTDSEKVIADNYGRNNVKLCTDFKMKRKEGIVKKMWFEFIGPKEPIKYNFRNPFIPVLFWNEQSLRKVVSPTRYFIDKQCSVCDEAEGNKIYDDKTLPQIMAVGEKAIGKGALLSAIKLSMYMNGMTVHGKAIVRGIKWLDRERKARNIPLTAIATHYGLEITTTRLRKKSFDETNQ